NTQYCQHKYGMFMQIHVSSFKSNAYFADSRRILADPSTPASYECTPDFCRGCPRKFSRQRFNLAFCAAALPAVQPRRSRETPLKRAHETGLVFVADNMRHLLDRHVASYQELCRTLQPELCNERADVSSDVLLKQPLEMCRAQPDFVRQFTHRTFR